ncbi:MAG: serine hydrolase [Desulfohalobiaceae bacterium]
MKLLILALVSLALFLPTSSTGYPLDGANATGMLRLIGYQQRTQPKGARLELDQVDIRLGGHQELTIPAVDQGLQQKLLGLLGEDSPDYAVSVLDLSDPDNPAYAEHRGLHRQNAGSVGKIVVGLGIFQALADIYPDSISQRQRILKQAMVTADEFIISDHHDVPLYDPETGRLSWRPIRQGDTANLYTYLDWMLSASSNAAAAMCMREAMLLVHFGREYPVSEDRIDDFFETADSSELRTLFQKAIIDPLTRNGIDTELFRQGSFFTRRGKQIVPGTTSYGCPREMLRFMLLMEQGRLVDTFSSRELKRLLYMTQRRIRYASSPALQEAAVYFKSGSLYSCKPEPGFVCRKYRGNRLNLLNPVCTV